MEANEAEIPLYFTIHDSVNVNEREEPFVSLIIITGEESDRVNVVIMRAISRAVVLITV